MGGFSGEELAFAFGIMGNIISFFVFLSPLPTFYKIYKKKSTAGFQSVPYVVALFSAMLLMYYAFLKIDNATLLITINSFGCLIETIYIGVYIFYAPKKGQTMKLLGLMIGGFGMILVLTQFLVKSHLLRLRIVGWICLVFSVSVFAAPLCILKQVIRTKSVEYMPFSLSLSLTLNAIMWFFYGLLIKDFNIAIPNVIGFFFGIIQMVLYAMYRNPKKFVPTEEKIPCDKITEHQMIVINDIPEKLPGKLADQVIDVVKLSAILCPEIIPHLNGNAIAGDFNHLNIPKPNMGIPVAV